MVRILSAAEAGCFEEAAAALRAGGLVCYPTDTVYGLGALATNDEAVRRLFALKGRPLEKALPLLLADPEDMTKVAAEVPPLAQQLMGRFWPGALTIVLPKAAAFHSLALAGGDTVAVRVPDQPFVRALIRRVGEPITGTSANRSGGRAPLTAAEVQEQMADAVDLIIDSGRCPGGLESTVIDITNKVRIVREGAIGREDLEMVLGISVAGLLS